jgi:large subunit ribosomal protein L19
VMGHGEVRRSRLYYLRALQGKAARLHQEEGTGQAAAAPAAPAAPAPTPA